MSEESDGENNTIVVHRPNWRSQGMYIIIIIIIITILELKLCEELDSRTERENEKHQGYIPSRLIRTEGTPLTTPPPSNCPQWAVTTSSMTIVVAIIKL